MEGYPNFKKKFDLFIEEGWISS